MIKHWKSLFFFTHYLMMELLSIGNALRNCVMIFPFSFTLLYFLILIPFYSIWTALPFRSHVTYPWGSPCFPYLWLTSLEAYFPFYSCTALHCPALPYDSHWLPFTLRLHLAFITGMTQTQWILTDLPQKNMRNTCKRTNASTATILDTEPRIVDPNQITTRPNSMESRKQWPWPEPWLGT